MTVRALCECNAVGLNLLKAVPKPKKYITFHFGVAERTYGLVQHIRIEQRKPVAGELPQSLKGTFVAFDFETTGLSIFYDKPRGAIPSVSYVALSPNA